jgi:hypothetical protein
MPVTELYAFNLICENLLAALYGVALRIITVAKSGRYKEKVVRAMFGQNHQKTTFLTNHPDLNEISSLLL